VQKQKEEDLELWLETDEVLQRAKEAEAAERRKKKEEAEQGEPAA
jgi:hypothetical protein